MQIPKNINQKLSNVENHNRVFIYDASIIIEFLQVNFFNLYEISKGDAYVTIGPGKRITEDMLVDDLDFKNYTSTELYNMYLMYRNAKDYTNEIESAYKFKIMLKKLTLPKNGWQFNVLRSGRDQKVIVFPLVLRTSRKSPNEKPLENIETMEAETILEGSLDDYDDKAEVLEGEQGALYEQPAEETIPMPVIEKTQFEKDFGKPSIEEIIDQVQPNNTDIDDQRAFDILNNGMKTHYVNEAVESPPQTHSSVPEDQKPLIIDPGLTDQY